jgi:hypothetical protein
MTSRTCRHRGYREGNDSIMASHQILSVETGDRLPELSRHFFREVQDPRLSATLGEIEMVAVSALHGAMTIQGEILQASWRWSGTG